MELIRGPAEAELVDVERGQPLAADCELTREQKLQLYRVRAPSPGVADAPSRDCPRGGSRCPATRTQPRTPAAR